LIEGKYKENAKFLVLYLGADLLGSYLGLLFGYMINGDNNTYILKPGHIDNYVSYVMFVEMVFTTLFLSSIMHIKYLEISINEDPILGLLTVAICLYGVIGMCGRISDACLNPTLGFAAVTF
jgi:glycerol uptake facilitator-like aquaporin